MSNPLTSLSKFKHVPLPLYGDSKYYAAKREREIQLNRATDKHNFQACAVNRDKLTFQKHKGSKLFEFSDMSMASKYSYFASRPEHLRKLVLKHLSKEDLVLMLNAKRKIEDHTEEEEEHPIRSRVLLKRFCKHGKISDMTKQLIEDVRKCNSTYHDLLYEFVGIIGTIIKCDRCVMYVLQTSGKELHAYVPAKHDGTGRSSLGYAGYIGEGTTVAAYVAYRKEAILVPDVHHDERFPRGIGGESSALTGSVICLPVLSPQDDVYCIMEFSRGCYHTTFKREDLHVSEVLKKQQELNNFLLEFSKIAFAELTSFEQLVHIIMAKTKSLVSADRCAMFLIDKRTSELYSFLLDNGEEDQDGAPVFVRKEIRFSVEKGIAGAVARTCQLINITDVYNDERFNREIDIQTGYLTRNILCMPIMMEGKAIGVVEMINKTKDPGCFTKLDEEAFKLLAIYSAIALHFSRLYSCIELETALRKVALEQVSYHYRISDDELHEMIACPELLAEELPVELDSYTFYGPEKHEAHLHKLFVTMVHRLLGPSCFDMSTLCRFILTVRKNYRPVAYHNWLHGFNVSHCMYCMLLQLKETTDLFSYLHIKALMIASLCHDVDHRGYSNAFFKRLNEPLAQLYTSSVMERHHYAVTVKILQEDGHNIFQDLDGTDYKQVLEYMRHAIISTDLALYTPNQQRLAALVSSNQLNLLNPDHFMYSVSLMMTAADLSAVCKSWAIQQSTVILIHDEFYRQGDVEKQLGMTPIKMMDRENISNVPSDQVGFIKFVCLPCYATLADIYVETKPMLDNCTQNMIEWQNIVTNKNWDPSDDIDPQEDFIMNNKKPSYLLHKKEK